MTNPPRIFRAVFPLVAALVAVAIFWSLVSHGDRPPVAANPEAANSGVSGSVASHDATSSTDAEVPPVQRSGGNDEASSGPLLAAFLDWLGEQGISSYPLPANQRESYAAKVSAPLQHEVARLDSLQRSAELADQYALLSSQHSVLKLTAELHALDTGSCVLLDPGVAAAINARFYSRFPAAWLVRMAPQADQDGSIRQLVILVDTKLHPGIAANKRDWAAYYQRRSDK